MKNKIIKNIFIPLVLSSSYLFADLITPSIAYDLALKNSNELKSSKFQLESQEEELNQTSANLYPQINASVTYNDVSNELNKLQNSSNNNINEDSTDLTLSLRQTIYNKEIYTRLDTEEMRVKLFELRYNRQKQELLKNVLTSYLNLLVSNTRNELLNSYINFNEYNFKLIDKRFKMNLSNKMDFLESKVDLEKSKIDYLKEKKLYNVYLLELKKTLGTENIEIPIIDLNIFSNDLVNRIYKSLENGSFHENLEVEQARSAIKLSKLEINQAYSLHYPKLDLNARYTKYITNDVDVDYDNSRRISLELQIPLYQGGSVSSRIESARLNYNASKEDLLALEKQMDVKFNETNTLLQSSLNSIKIFNSALKSSKTYLDSIKLGHEKGLKSIVELQGAQSKVLEIKSDFIYNLKDLVEAYIDLMIITNRLENIKYIDLLILGK